MPPGCRPGELALNAAVCPTTRSPSWSQYHRRIWPPGPFGLLRTLGSRRTGKTEILSHPGQRVVYERRDLLRGQSEGGCDAYRQVSELGFPWLPVVGEVDQVECAAGARFAAVLRPLVPDMEFQPGRAGRRDVQQTGIGSERQDRRSGVPCLRKELDQLLARQRYIILRGCRTGRRHSLDGIEVDPHIGHARQLS